MVISKTIIIMDNTNQILERYRRLWDNIHTKAAQVKTPQQHQEFCLWMRQIVSTMSCPSCRAHAQQYVLDNPPENAKNAFVWTWEFHNNVNQRLGKPQLDYGTAAIRYLNWTV
jgi:hypothetical protein